MFAALAASSTSRRHPLADAALISVCAALTAVCRKAPGVRLALSNASSRAELLAVLRHRKGDCPADVAAGVLGCLAWVAPPGKCADLASADVLTTLTKLLAAHAADVRVACDCIEVLRAAVCAPGPASYTLRSLGAAAPLTKALELHGDKIATAAGVASVLGSMAAVVDAGSRDGAGGGTGRAAEKRPAERGGGCTFAEQARVCILALRKHTGAEPSSPRTADVVASLMYALSNFAALDAGEAIAADGGCAALVVALNLHGAHPGVAMHGLTAIAYMDGKKPVHEQLVVAKATAAVIRLLSLHGSDADARSVKIVHMGCAAIFNLSDDRATLDQLAAEGAAICLLKVLSNFAGPAGGDGKGALEAEEAPASEDAATAAAAASAGAGAAANLSAPIASTAAAARLAPPSNLPACIGKLAVNELSRSQLLDGRAPEQLLRLLHLHGGDADLCCHVISALTELLAGYDESLAFARLPGAAAAVVATVNRHVGTFAVAGPGSTLMQRLAVTDEGRDALIGAGASSALVRVLTEHHTSPLGGLVVRAACLALDKLCFDRSEGARLQASEPKLVPLLIKILRGFKSGGLVVAPACAVLGKASSARPETLAALKVAPLLVEALQLHGHHEDFAVPAGIVVAVHTMAECPPAADALIAAGGLQAVAGLATAESAVTAAAAATAAELAPELKACLILNPLLHLLQRPAAGEALSNAACTSAVSAALLRLLRAHKANVMVAALACRSIDAASQFPAFCASMGRSGMLPALLAALRAHEANEEIATAVLSAFDRALALGDAECAALLVRLDLPRDLDRVVAAADVGESEATRSLRVLAGAMLEKLRPATAEAAGAGSLA